VSSTFNSLYYFLHITVTQLAVENSSTDTCSNERVESERIDREHTGFTEISLCTATPCELRLTSPSGPHLGLHGFRYRLDRRQVCDSIEGREIVQSGRLRSWPCIGLPDWICVDIHSHVSSQLFSRILGSGFWGTTFRTGFVEILSPRDCRFAPLLDRHISCQIRLSSFLWILIRSVQVLHASLVGGQRFHGVDFPDMFLIGLLGLRSSSAPFRSRYSSSFLPV